MVRKCAKGHIRLGHTDDCTLERGLWERACIGPWLSSIPSSSKSVVSVPLEVTGEGPTKSLGLVTCPPGESPPSKELGFRRDGSVDWWGDLKQDVSEE